MNLKLANIVHEKELINHIKLDYVNYYNQPIEYDVLDKTLPTLYVGWSFMKDSNKNNEIIQNTNILYKKIISNELYWECSYEESKSSHVKGVEQFVNLIPTFYFSPKYGYINIDPVFFQLRDIEDLMDVIPTDIIASYNYRNDLIYLVKDNKIWGINLETFKYFKFNTLEILKRISERTVITVDDIDGDFYKKYYRIFPNYTQLKKYMVIIVGLYFNKK